jgi:hypothetical protein
VEEVGKALSGATELGLQSSRRRVSG